MIEMRWRNVGRSFKLWVWGWSGCWPLRICLCKWWAQLQPQF